MSRATLSATPYSGIFRPTSIAGCQLWLDAADATTFTITSGSNVSTWSDKSGSNSSLSNTTSNPPYFTTYNGYPTVSFRGSLSSTSNVLSNQTFSVAPANISIFIVTQALQNGSTYIYPGILTIFPNPLSGYDYRNGFSISGGNATSQILSVYGGGTGNTITGIDYSGSGLTPRGVYSVVNTTNILYAYANGTQWGTNTFTFDATNVGIALGMRHLGSLRAEGGASAYDGNISEVIVYNTALTTTQRQQVEGYLAWKWGLQAQLPITHLQYAATPTGANLRPAISIALAPTGVRSLGNASYNAAFLPTSIAGCAMWLDGADPAGTGVAPANGATVSTWVDKSGSGNSGIATNTSTYTSGGGILFNTSYYSTTYTANPTNETAFVVFKTTARVTSDLIVCSPNGCREFYIDGNDTVFINSKGAFVITTAGLFPISNVIQLLEYTYSTSAVSIYKYGSSVASVTGSFAFTGSSTTFIGGNDRGYMTGYIYEVIIYNSVLTTIQRQQIEGYLAWKWGLQASLPQSLAPPFTNPTTIPGCILWLDATDPLGTGVQPANGTTLTTWKDKSVSNFPFTSVGSAYNTTAVNGLPGMTLSTNFIGYDPGSAQNNWQEVFAVGLWTGGSTFNSYNGLVTGSIDSGTDGIVFIGNAGSTSWYGSGNGYQTPFLNGTQTGVALPAISTPFQIRTFTGSAVSIRGLRFGIDRSWTDRKWVGFISEVICYNTALTATQRLQIEGYLAWKWGSQGSLVNTHTYYSASPAHSHSAAAPVGANLRPALSAALVPAGVRTAAALRKLQSYTQTFSYTGANQTFPVPAGVTSLTVHMWGAGGGGGHTGTQGATAGGAGAYVQGTLTVTPNNSLTIIVGGGGTHGSVGVAYGGGGSASSAAYGGGGGRSAIQLSGTELVNAGGGGGAGYDCSGGHANFSPTINGGAGYPGLTGASWPFDSGAGGTQTAGGAGGPGNASSYGVASPGTYLAGGAAAPYAGGGGSGYYGGGGGNTNDTNGAGGGGGSSYTTNAAFTLITGSNSSNGYSAPASASPYYASGVAAGSTNMTTGGNGRIVLVYLA